MNPAAQIKVVLSPVFRARLQCQERNLVLDAQRPTVGTLLQQLSRETDGQIDPLLFETGGNLISAGLMVQVDDRVYTGTQLNQEPVPLRDQAVVTLLYYVSGG